jgi:hypothetical protein
MGRAPKTTQRRVPNDAEVAPTEGTDNADPPIHMNDLGHSSRQQAEDRAEELGGDAERLFAKIERNKATAWADNMRLAEVLAGIAEIAMQLSGANSRRGRGYVTRMDGLLKRHAPKLSEERFGALRAALLNIHEHRAEVEAWRADWSENRRQTWLSPITVWREFNKERLDKPRADRRASVAKVQSDDFVQRAAEEVERKHLENRRLRVNALLDCDAKEKAMLLWEACGFDPEEGAAVMAEFAALMERGRPSQEPDGWPVTALREDADDAEEGDVE